jgi:hypothetical protein
MHALNPGEPVIAVVSAYERRYRPARIHGVTTTLWMVKGSIIA